MHPLRVLAVGQRLTEDLLFWERLARSLTASAGHPTVVLHGPGEMTARRLEGEGLDADAVLRTGSPAQQLELALRQENRHAVGALTDHQVSSVGFLGTDRGQLTWEAEGRLRARGKVLASTARLGVVPVLGCLARPAAGTLMEDAPGADFPPPTLAQVLDALALDPDFPGFWIGWMVSRPLEEPIMPGNACEWSGERALPMGAMERGVSVRVLGVSDVASGGLDAGVELEL